MSTAALDGRETAGDLKILVFLHSFDAGGVERVALRLAGAWADANCDVVVALGRRTGPLESEAPGQVRYVQAPTFPLVRHFETLWMMPLAVRTVLRERPDVIFCAGNTYAVVSVALRMLLGRNCPPIVTKISNCLRRPEMPSAWRWGYRQWLRVQARCIDRFVGLSAAMLPEMGETLGLQPPRIAVVEDPALELSDLARPANARSRPAGAGRLFVAVGRLAPQKDFPSLIRAFARACSASDRLRILGEGPERGRITRLARRLGVAGQVALPGHVGTVSEELQRADALVLSSRYEGVPAVVLEALAAACPIVATDCCASMRDLVGGGRFGQVVPVGDTAALAAALRNSPQIVDGDAMRDFAAAFTVERAAPRYLEIMREAVAARSRGGADPVT